MSGLALAQTQPAAEQGASREASTKVSLEEVYVTARRREESLQETPVAVSALGADALAEAGVSSITDLQQLVPGLQFGESGSKTPAIFIRGIGQREASAVLDPGVGVYLNGIFLARQDTQLLDTVDTQSIQVLRGPQGTLFGKNNTGGAMLVNTRAANLFESEFGATVKAGNFGRQDVKLYGNLPLLEDKMATRFGISSKRFDGDIENADGETFGDEDRLALSLRTQWQVSDQFGMDLFAYWSRQSERSTPLNCILQNPEANIVQLIYPNQPAFSDSCAASERAADKHEITVNSDDSIIAMQSTMLALTLTWDFFDYEIKSISAWSHQYDIERNDDQDGTSIHVIDNGTRALNDVLRADGEEIRDEKRDQFSQELQIVGSAFDDRLSYTVGAFASLERIDDNPFAQVIGPKGLAGIDPSTVSDAIIPGLPSAGDGFVFPLTTLFGGFSSLENKSWAVFSQFTWSITDTVQLTMGGRYTFEERERALTLVDIDEQTYGQRIGASYIDQAGFYTPITRAQFDQIGRNLPDLPVDVREDADVRSEEWSNFTPAVTLSVQASEDWLEVMNLDSALWYATYSEGFKAGGFEPRGPELVAFDPEEVVNYELGVKLDSLDSTLRFNAAAYVMDYTDIHVRVAEQGERISDIFLFLTNAGEATIQGVEMETTFLLGNWVFSASANYTDASYDEYTATIVTPGQGESVVDRSDEPFALVPETSYSFTAQYNWMSSVGLIVPRLSLYHRDELFTGIDFLAVEYESSTVDALTLVNARLNYFPSEKFRVAAYVDNLTDEEYFKSGFAVSALLGAATLVQGTSRTIGMEFSYDF
ncbi:outer membrane receptor protein involved in Fe transport [Litorivivens lipolytica]|uniref:Outer membrane receptor protein involved in Fe transport n=1 Tax=Litorivivens lipolytica TaxID=1524264 RepID=A0A7W4W7Z7_9GAMM|nr:TonB-dependent receptor [Litorivivens lipolytica]MBB3048569.1 outer membrane receptor protein involved in Fe transport [Litorivivens lipolytica]